jgi:hypothetical protein
MVANEDSLTRFSIFERVQLLNTGQSTEDVNLFLFCREYQCICLSSPKYLRMMEISPVHSLHHPPPCMATLT